MFPSHDPDGKSGFYDIGFGSRIDLNGSLTSFECGLTISSATEVSRSIVAPNNTGNTQYIICNFKGLKLDAGDTVEFYHRKSGTNTVTWNTDTRYNYLTISESPESLQAAVGDADKCQTKYLQADVTVNGNLPDLTFNNLSPTKTYKVCGRLNFLRTTSSVDNVGLNGFNDGNFVFSVEASASSTNQVGTS